MGKLIYNPEDSSFLLLENDRDKGLSINDHFNKRKYCYFSRSKNIKQDYRLLSLFGIDDTNLSSCEHVNKDEYWEDRCLIIADNVNPYIMKINWRCVVYFGEDMPKIKSKTVKTKTKHYMQWTGNTIYKEPKLETYYYVEVEDEDKLFFFFACGYDFYNGERLIEFNEKNIEHSYYYHNRENFDYIARLDYTDERYNELVKEKILCDKKKKEEERKRFDELEKRKKTPGYCSVCGCEHASYIADPFDCEMNNIITMRWLCSSCYNDLLGDI